MLATVSGQLNAREFFVQKQGDDANNGLSTRAAFQTIQKGLDALQAGDTLTIGPGEYAEGVRSDVLGDLEKETIIRAQIPGTVHLRGDVSPPVFRKVEGYRFVYAAEFERDVQAVNEMDTLTILQSVTSVDELEFSPGGCFHDAENKKLYISTSDLQPPEAHQYTVSVIRDFGLLLMNPKRVVIDGLSTSGFHSNTILRYYPGTHTVWGIMAAGARQCVIRNCTAFLNGGGIGMFSSKEGEGHNLIEKCQAFANYSKYTQEGGNICSFQSFHDEIRDCYAYMGIPNGIRFYGAGVRGPALLKNCRVWGSSYADIFLKGGQASKYAVAENCISLGIFHSANVKNCLIGTINQYNRKPARDNIVLGPMGPSIREGEFADPENLDFRLQSTSGFRGAGPDGQDRGPLPYETNVFYVKPDGSDAADGLSMKYAWQTLGRAMKSIRPGHTIYLEGGTYKAGDVHIKSIQGEETSIRGRGTKPVIVNGSLSISDCRDVTFERLNFTETVQIENCRKITINNCRFSSEGSSISATSSSELKTTHCEFTGFKKPAMQIKTCSGLFLSANIFDNTSAAAVQIDDFKSVQYSDYNAYADDKRAWAMNESIHGLSELLKNSDQYSQHLTPRFVVKDGLPVLQNRERFTTGGPNGTWLGFYREYRERPIRLEGPIVHSTTDTTANIEWWTSRLARVEVAWGESQDCIQRVRLDAENFGTFSLTGLKPGRRYYFRIVSVEERNGSSFATPLTAGIQPQTKPLTFETATQAAPAKKLYVAPNGDDKNDGLSRAQAFQTVSRAASQAVAGDTVLIAGGKYRETVRVRATGSEDRPVTFKAMPGERVDFDGDFRKLTVGFAINSKQHLRFDGLYFKMFGNKGWESVFNVFDSQHVQLTRCFMNGATGAGNSPQLLRTHNCKDVLMQNCVVASGFQGTYFTQSTDLRIENNVFLRNLICPILNSGGEPKGVVIRNNIFVDSIPSKVQVHLFELGGIDQYVFDNNCFYLRLPDAERRPFLFYGKGPGRLSMGEYEKLKGDTRSVFAYPQFRITKDKEPKDRTGKKIKFLADWLAGQRDIDFPDLFTLHSELMKRDVGLQPEVFRDFHFNK